LIKRELGKEWGLTEYDFSDMFFASTRKINCVNMDRGGAVNFVRFFPCSQKAHLSVAPRKAAIGGVMEKRWHLVLVLLAFAGAHSVLMFMTLMTTEHVLATFIVETVICFFSGFFAIEAYTGKWNKARYRRAFEQVSRKALGFADEDPVSIDKDNIEVIIKALEKQQAIAAGQQKLEGALFAAIKSLRGLEARDFAGDVIKRKALKDALAAARKKLSVLWIESGSLRRFNGFETFNEMMRACEATPEMFSGIGVKPFISFVDTVSGTVEIDELGMVYLARWLEGARLSGFADKPDESIES